MPSGAVPFGPYFQFFLSNPRVFPGHPKLGMRVTLFLVGTVWAAFVNSACRAQTLTAPSPLHVEIEGKAPAPDRVLDLPPLPKGEVSLIGGMVARMDPIHDRIVVRAFGGRDVTVDFDVRTAVLRGATTVSAREIRPGTRIYADTILKDGRIFAKTVRIETNATLGETRGQVTGYDAAKRVLHVRDIISSQPFTVRLTGVTEIRAGGEPVQATELVSGTLVRVFFRSGFEGVNSAQKIDILARPGSTFTFSGKIAVLDLRDRHLTLSETSSDNTFEVALDSLPSDAKLRLKEGMDVVVQARFDGHKYQAQRIEPVSTSQQPTPQP